MRKSKSRFRFRVNLFLKRLSYFTDSLISLTPKFAAKFV